MRPIVIEPTVQSDVSAGTKLRLDNSYTQAGYLRLIMDETDRASLCLRITPTQARKFAARLIEGADEIEGVASSLPTEFI